MVETRRFGIWQACLVHRQNRATTAIRANRQANRTFMPTHPAFPVMPRPTDLNSPFRCDIQHLARHAMLPAFRFDHHRGPRTRPGEIETVFAKRDPFRAPLGGQMIWRRDEFEDPVRRQWNRLFDAQIGHRRIPFGKLPLRPVRPVRPCLQPYWQTYDGPLCSCQAR